MFLSFCMKFIFIPHFTCLYVQNRYDEIKPINLKLAKPTEVCKWQPWGKTECAEDSTNHESTFWIKVQHTSVKYHLKMYRRKYRN